MTRAKIVILGVLLIAGIASQLFLQNQFRARISERDAVIQQQAQRITQLESEDERLSNLVVFENRTVPANGNPSEELLRLRGEVGLLRHQTNELGELQVVTQPETNQPPIEDQLIVRQTHAVDAITELLQALKNYATNHDKQLPAELDQLIASGDLGATNLAGNFTFNDFDFGLDAGGDPRSNRTILRLRVPIAKPGGGGVMVVGGINDAGVPFTSVWNVAK